MHQEQSDKDLRAITAKLAECIDENFRKKGRKLYHPILLPNFSSDHLIVDERGFSKKAQAIFGKIESERGPDLKGVHILDVGANSGFFTFSAAMKNASVLSFEPDQGHSAISACLRDYYDDCDVEWLAKPYSQEDLRGRKFDYAFVLSVFQWMAQGGDRLTEATRELRTVSEAAQAMFFELGYNEGGSCLSIDESDHLGFLMRFLRENTVYERFELLLATKLYKYRGLAKVKNLLRKRQRYLVYCSKS